mgnify:CR=1 FL=1
MVRVKTASALSSVAVSAARIASGNGVIAYDEPVDLAGYDIVFSGKGV